MNISKIVGWWPQALIYSLMFPSAAFGSRYDTPPKVNVEIEQRAIIPSKPVRERHALNYCTCGTADTENLVTRKGWGAATV
jgi:hypothetical protein